LSGSWAEVPLGGTSGQLHRNFRSGRKELWPNCAEELLLNKPGRNFRLLGPELPPVTEKLQNFRTAKAIHRSNIIFESLYLSTSTHIKIYIVLMSNTQNPKGREMFFQACPSFS
jgi:hypothetical protein